MWDLDFLDDGERKIKSNTEITASPMKELGFGLHQDLCRDYVQPRGVDAFAGGGYAGDLSTTTVSVAVTVSDIEAMGSVVSEAEVSAAAGVFSLTSLGVSALSSTAISASSGIGGVVFSSVASPLSFWRTGLIEFVGEIESGGWPFPWPFVGVEAWGMLRGTNEGN